MGWVEFEVLGQVRAWAGGQEIELGPARQRSVLAALLVHVNQPVSVERLAECVWGAAPPQRAAGTLHSYLSRLRTALPATWDGGIRRGSGGYLLRAEEDAVDLHRFHALLARARASAGEGPAADLYEQALGLWRGAPLDGLDTPWAATLRHALESERFTARLDHHDLRLSRGEHAALLTDLTSLAVAHPLDERLAGQLVLALYRCGRQAEALVHYEQTRLRLAEELGVDTGPELRRLHQQILTADPALTATPSATVPTPRQLPAPPPTFAGRAHELAALDEAAGQGGRTVVISAIGGTGGIGKTWLALHWAHRNLHRFPDGQLYVNLRGFDPSDTPVSPETAVRGFLQALGTDPGTIPSDPQAQAALYRTLVAGKRMLIMLDNARDTAQVTPLLPGGPSSAVLVTSRHQLTGLVTGHGARPITLDVLDPAESHQTLTRHLGTGRTHAEPAATDELLAHCAGLPLALGIIAARAAMQPRLPLSELAGQLRAYALDAFDAGEHHADLRTVFSWSYRALTPSAARLFKLLGTTLGPDIDRDAVASLTGLAAGEVRPLLAELIRAHLLIEHLPGRYTMHDLVWAYAVELVTASDEYEPALHRLLGHYLHSAYAAGLQLNRHRRPLPLGDPPPGTTPVEPADDGQALAWLTSVHQVILSAVQQADRTGLDSHAWQLASAIGDYLDRQGHWNDLLSTQRTALSAARRQADKIAEAQAHCGLARAHIRLGQYDDARTRLRQALALYVELADIDGQARTHQGLSFILEKQGRYADAITHSEQSLHHFRTTGNVGAIAMLLNSLGYHHALLGDHEQAILHCRQALDLAQENGYKHGQAQASDSLGYAHHRLGRRSEAIDHYERAVRLYQDVGDRWGEADTLVHLGDVQEACGDEQAARDTLGRALGILEQLDDPDADKLRARLNGHASR
ncbi:BTAD domain-containing putative transcriptional regulator [Nonomuraea sp. B12E4]|uniref:AfsR/SARP family transcriptional regulator n=1 Tax=Nonomuraea sp. B12E4 TaxID=3153564 RepID=UPI00325FC228